MMKQSKKKTSGADYIGYLFCVLIIIGIFKFTDYCTGRENEPSNPEVLNQVQAIETNTASENLDDDLTEGIIRGIREEKIQQEKIEAQNKVKQEKALRSKDMEALTFCQTIVKNSLKAPSTADIPFAQPTVDIENAIFTVRSYVDSQNSYGAMLRTNYVCMLKYMPEYAVPWRVERFEFLN